jgi:biopolymer transport protein ExbB/TolQ
MPIWVEIVGWVTKAVFVVLLSLSVYSISIIINRYRFLKTQDDLPVYEKARGLIAAGKYLELKNIKDEGLRSSSLLELLGQNTANTQKLDRAFNSWSAEKRSHLEKGLTSLATLGNNTPFIGLFGTVLGIIQAFGAMAHSTGGSNTVMAAIAEALIATAIGLFVAIPAVMAFNYYNRWIKDMMTHCEILRDHFIAQNPAQEAAR